MESNNNILTLYDNLYRGRLVVFNLICHKNKAYNILHGLWIYMTN